MTDSNDSDTTRTLDTPSEPVAEGPPSDVLEIVASLAPDGSEDTPILEDAPPADEATDTEGSDLVDAGSAPEQPVIVDAEAATRALEGQASVAETEISVAPEYESLMPTEDVVSDRARVPAWPFLAYVVVWIASAVAAGWLLAQTSPGVPVFSIEIYRTVVMAGLALTAIGPILVLVVWLTLLARNRSVSHAGLFTGSLMRGALATLCGVAIWWGMLVIIDTIRLGRPL